RLDQHDFFYAGESGNRRMYLVRRGRIAWSYDDPGGKGEISDAILLGNGNILFAHQFGVTEIAADKHVLWHYDAPAGTEIHTAVPIGEDRVLFLQNGDPALLKVVNLRTGITEKELKLTVGNPGIVHPQLRHARLTAAGTLLVAHMDRNRVSEYDEKGVELWSFPAESPWGVTPLANGNVLITDRVGVREVTHQGDTVWAWTPAQAPGYPIKSLQQAWRLPSGNTVVNNWQSPGPQAPSPLQALELTPSGSVVWMLRSWSAPADLGPATTLQFLGDDATPLYTRFGSLH
ncbi:MAG TPA: hypothetical protein VGD62_05455, partial [Acidobacteriaceae bacterium]